MGAGTMSYESRIYQMYRWGTGLRRPEELSKLASIGEDRKEAKEKNEDEGYELVNENDEEVEYIPESPQVEGSISR